MGPKNVIPAPNLPASSRGAKQPFGGGGGGMCNINRYWCPNPRGLVRCWCLCARTWYMKMDFG